MRICHKYSSKAVYLFRVVPRPEHMLSWNYNHGRHHTYGFFSGLFDSRSRFSRALNLDRGSLESLGIWSLAADALSSLLGEETLVNGIRKVQGDLLARETLCWKSWFQALFFGGARKSWLTGSLFNFSHVTFIGTAFLQSVIYFLFGLLIQAHSRGNYSWNLQ